VGPGIFVWTSGRDLGLRRGADTTGDVGLAGDNLNRQLDRSAPAALLLDAWSNSQLVGSVVAALVAEQKSADRISDRDER
jgi:hypothetical protein